MRNEPRSAWKGARPTLDLDRFLPYRLSVLTNRVSNAIARHYSERFDLTTQLFTHALVGVETQDPIVRGALHGKLLLRAVPRPVAVDYSRAKRRRDFPSGIGGMGINHDRLVAEAR